MDCGLLYDDSVSIPTTEEVENFGRKPSCPNPRTCLEGLRKTAKNMSQVTYVLAKIRTKFLLNTFLER
jgi:hypothetical protein